MTDTRIVVTTEHDHRGYRWVMRRFVPAWGVKDFGAGVWTEDERIFRTEIQRMKENLGSQSYRFET